MSYRLSILLIILLPVLAGFFLSILPAIGFYPHYEIYKFSMSHIFNFFYEPGIIISIIKSFFIGITSTVFSWWVVMLVLSNYYQNVYMKSIIKILMPVLTIPHVSMAIGFLFLIQPSGFIMRIISPELTGWYAPNSAFMFLENETIIIILAIVLKEIPFLLLMSVSALTQFDAENKISISRSLGYSKTQAWFYIIQPKLFKLLKVPILIVLVFSISVVDMVAVISTSPLQPLAFKVYIWSKDPSILSKFNASVGALILTVLSVTSCFIFLMFQKFFSHLVKLNIKYNWTSKLEVAFFKVINVSLKIFNFLIVHLILLFVIGTFVILLLWSFAENWFFPENFPKSFTLRNWNKFAINNLYLLKNTLIIGMLSSFISILFSIIWLENHLKNIDFNLEKLFYLPLFLPQASFLIGVNYIFYNLGVTGSYIGVIWSHIIFVFPYVFLSLAPFWKNFNIDYVYLSRSLEKSYWEILFRIKISILIIPILIAFTIGILVSGSLYLPTVFISEGRISTLNTEIISFASGNSRQIIGVTSVTQMLLPMFFFISITVFYFFRSKKFNYFRV